MKKRFQAVWGNDFHKSGKRKVGLEFFDASVGYTDEDRAAIDALGVGETWRSPDGTNHTVTRIS